MSKMTRFAGGAIFVAVLLFSVGTPFFTQAMSLAYSQINAFVGVIQSFGINQDTASASVSSSAFNNQTPASSITPVPTDPIVGELRQHIVELEMQLHQLRQGQLLDQLNQGEDVSHTLSTLPPKSNGKWQLVVIQPRITIAQITSIDYGKKIFTARVIEGKPDIVTGFMGKYHEKVFVGFENRICIPRLLGPASASMGANGTCNEMAFPASASKFGELKPGHIVIIKGNIYFDIEANAIYPSRLSTFGETFANTTIVVARMFFNPSISPAKNANWKRLNDELTVPFE